MTLDVTDNITVTGNMNSLNLNVDGYYNSTVKVSLTKIKLELIAVETFVKLLINGLINPGISLNEWLSTHTMLRFFNLTEMEIIVENDYLMVGLTPQFDHRQVQDTLLATNYWLDFAPEIADQLLSDDDMKALEEEIAAIKSEAQAVHAIMDLPV